MYPRLATSLVKGTLVVWQTAASISFRILLLIQYGAKKGFSGNVFCNCSNCVAQATQFVSEWRNFSVVGNAFQFAVEKVLTYSSFEAME